MVIRYIFTLLLIPLCFASSNVFFGGLAVTLVPHPTGNPSIALEPLNIDDPNQQWNLPPTGTVGVISSANPAYSTFVWDVNAASTTAGAKIILYPQKPGTNNNELWNVSASGVFTSKLAPNYTLKANGTTNLVTTYQNPPTQATIQPSETQPYYCSSVGDPHILTYPGGRNDLYMPGNQIPGSFILTLSKTDNQGDPNYNQIQADQQLCNPAVPGIYCNKRVIIRTNGHLVQVADDTVTVDGVVVPVTGTYVVGPGLNITKLGTGDYVINFPNGNVQAVGNPIATNLYITMTSGPIPTGGVCSQNLGPNQPAPIVKRDVTAYQFCYSWRVPNMSMDLFAYSDELAWEAANPSKFNSSNGNVTTTNQTLINDAEGLCAPLAPNSALVDQCSELVPTPAAGAYQACLMDVIATNDYSFAMSNVDAYAKRCSSKNSSIILPTSSPNCIAQGPGLAGNIDQSSSLVNFTITSKDVNGRTVPTGGDNYIISISGGISFTLTYLGSGVYVVTYAPSVYATLTISISLNGAPIRNSPFTVNVEATETVAANSTASGPGLGPTISSGTFFSFTVTARTASGAARTTGGDDVEFSVGGVPEYGDPPVVDQGNGNYTCTYMQDLADAFFDVNVTIGGEHIEGSPFTVYVDDD